MLKVLAAQCVGGSCPTIYEDEAGQIVVQGKLIELKSEAGEALVAISRELLEQALTADAHA
jgi:hypothetical protein